MAWTNLTFSFGSTLSSSQMTQLFDDFQAFADKASGAPVLANNYVTNAMMATNAIGQTEMDNQAVGQAELKTGTETDSTTSTTPVQITVASAQYAFQSRLGASTATAYLAVIGNHIRAYGGASYGCALYLESSSVSSTAYHQITYITASPPYDLGDGEIPLFVFALLDKAGKVISAQVCEEPVWAHNGPTIIKPDFYDRHGVGQQIQILLPDDPEDVAGRIRAFDKPEFRICEVNQAVKNADMDIIPHPFLENDLTGLTPVLLDPVSPVVQRLAAMNAYGENVNELLHSGYINIGNTEIKRKGPQGLHITPVSWRLTT